MFHLQWAEASIRNRCCTQATYANPALNQSRSRLFHRNKTVCFPILAVSALGCQRLPESENCNTNNMGPWEPHIALDLAGKVYTDVWDGGPYTNFDMIKYLIEKTRIKRKDRESFRRGNLHAPVRHSFIIQTVSDENSGRESMRGRLLLLLNGRMDLWTSFAIKLVRMLERSAPPGTFNFVFYDIGPHRMARCKRTEIVIDSSVGYALRSTMQREQ